MSMASGVPNEFKLIARHFAPLSLGFSGAYELRDDAAEISPSPGFELVVKTDAKPGLPLLRLGSRRTRRNTRCI